MNINFYCYDDVNNPRCGGGGAYRDLNIHKVLAAQGHTIHFYTGNFPGALSTTELRFFYKHRTTQQLYSQQDFIRTACNTAFIVCASGYYRNTVFDLCSRTDIPVQTPYDYRSVFSPDRQGSIQKIWTIRHCSPACGNNRT